MVIWFLAALSAALLGIVVLVLGDTEGSGATRACAPELRRGVLPAWARAGFSDEQPRMPHAVGRDGKIAALVDLPAAGCWRLTLRWGDREDSLDLAYARGRR